MLRYRFTLFTDDGETFSRRVLADCDKTAMHVTDIITLGMHGAVRLFRVGDDLSRRLVATWEK